ncbi:MAG: Thioredoxin [Marmoricola sp.]|nr:Thioredoxin [Marmoricola sp.]
MPTRQRTPGLGGATGWLNSEPLGSAELSGHTVLVNFWTLTCINWLRTVPYVRAWSRAYRADGLVVIGVHTPEFSFEQNLELVGQAVTDRAIDFPVAADNDFEIWNAFDNHYWPALYFIDPAGTVRDQHFGEGSYERSEQTLQRLLGVSRDLVSVQGSGVEAEADWAHLLTPETYLGHGRSQNVASANGAHDRGKVYALPACLPLNHWALDGVWTVGSERAVLDQAGGSIAFRFHARDAHLVLASRRHEPIGFRVLLDGQPPGRSHGVDVDHDGTGTLRGGRMYQLVREHDTVRERTLQITFLEPGVEAYAFTFG